MDIITTFSFASIVSIVNNVDIVIVVSIVSIVSNVSGVQYCKCRVIKANKNCFKKYMSKHPNSSECVTSRNSFGVVHVKAFKSKLLA